MKLLNYGYILLDEYLIQLFLATYSKTLLDLRERILNIG